MSNQGNEYICIMYTTVAENVIPKYALEPDDTGNRVFRLNKFACSVIRMRADFLVPHRKDYFFLVLVHEGKSRHWVDMTPYVLKNNTFYFTVPHQVHLKEESEPLTGTSISFTREFLGMMPDNVKQLPIIQNPQNGHELSLSADDLVYISDLIKKMEDEYHAKNNWQHSMLTAYMQALLVYLSRLYQEQLSNPVVPENRLLLKRFLLKVEENYSAAHEVGAYATMLNISAGHLSELVKEQSGQPAIAHIHERLMVEAKRLLFHTEHSVKEIAFELGFEDASYFNRFFKRISNVTPVEYRIATREMYQ
jgi:AraC family transcriptional regulator, transcriptional activator of pobA